MLRRFLFSFFLSPLLFFFFSFPASAQAPPTPTPLLPVNYRFPPAEGWLPLTFPCNDTSPGSSTPPDAEFHPFRPYPGSPCDPQIPARVEFSTGFGNNTFSCGKSVNPSGSYRYLSSFTCAEYNALPTPPAVPAYGTLYRDTPLCDCAAGCVAPSISVWERPNFDINVDLSGAQLPIVGNTQDIMDDATKVNNYLDWYLAGVYPTWLDDSATSGGDNPTTSQCIGQSLASYLNTVIAGAGSLSNIRLLSPVFNITNPAEADIFNAMVTAGANFSALDGFAANTYTLSGVRAYRDWYVSRTQADGLTWRQRFLSTADLSVYFTEFGDFDTFNNPPGSPGRPNLINTRMRPEFTAAVTDNFRSLSTDRVAAVLYFNAFGGNPQFTGHLLGDIVAPVPATGNELATITQLSAYRTGAGVNSARIIDLSGDFADRVNQNSLSWALEIITGPSDVTPLANLINSNASVNFILRLCYGSSCGFADPSALVQFLTSLNSELIRPVWIIAGPNEPATETWASSTCTLPGFAPDPFLTYAGPLKKLLSFNTQNDIRLLMSSWPVRANFVGYHDYRLNEDNDRMSSAPSNPPPYFDPTDPWATLFPRIPLATLEDVVGEVTLSLVTTKPQNLVDCSGNPVDPADPYSACDTWNQPEGVYLPNPGNSLDPFAMRLRIADADPRLYLPHLKYSTSLSRLLASLFRPYGSRGLGPPGADRAQYAGQHQGLFSNFGVLEPDNQVFVQTEFNEGGWSNPLATRNTELRENAPAPEPLFRGDDPTYNAMCDINQVIYNPGDNLIGSSINGRLGYTQRFTYTPTITGTGGTGSCLPDWTPGCNTSPDPCCSGDCSFIDLPPSLPANWYCRGTSPSRVTLDTSGRVAVYVKSPYIDNVYDNTVAAPDSIVRRWIPLPPTPMPGTEPNPAIRVGLETFPVVSSVNYSAFPASDPEPDATGPSLGGISVTAGSGGQAEIYFARLGSLFQYFMGASTDDVYFNLQDAFVPLELNPRVP